MDHEPEHATIGDLFFERAGQFADHAFIAAPARAGRDYHPDGYEITYAQAEREVRRLIDAYRDAGFGHGHRIALSLESRPEYLLHRLALNHLGVSAVPINPAYRAAEISHLFDNSRADLVIGLNKYREIIEVGAAEADHDPIVIDFEDFETGIPRPLNPPPVDGLPGPETESSLLYTSGTTGKPKGCMLSHNYELWVGKTYAETGGYMTQGVGTERIFNPLPLFHCNSATVSFYGALYKGNCQIQPDQFHASTWWQDVVDTRATIIHYLGIIAPALLKREETEIEKQHRVRFGMGAGVEPDLHGPFEDRFGFPLIEGWGMTEIVRILTAHEDPRKRGTRAFGRARPTMEIRVVDDDGNDVPDDQPGEMVLRHSAETPRKGFFSGYLRNEAATEEAWRGGWFHTGDLVYRAPDGMLHFVDRKKHIIRRSGENIAAAEVEAELLNDPGVQEVAVVPAPDEMRQEEVCAFVSLRDKGEAGADKAETLFSHCFDRLADYKAPGWIYFIDDIPKTPTQKIQKHLLLEWFSDPDKHGDFHDFRDRKKRVRRA